MPVRAGVYRRRIRLTSEGEVVVADLEDDFHRFRVTLRHNGDRVTGVAGEALRFPWTTCPGAVDLLEELVGMSLSPRATAVGEISDARRHCTHLFDLAGLAVALAARGDPRIQYDAVVPERDEAGATQARLSRDGELALSWRIEGGTIVAPALFEGVRLRGGFLRWADSHLDPETAEAAAVLRRACEIGLGRQFGFDRMEKASEVGEFMLGTCHTFQPGNFEVALRVPGTTRDFTDRPDALLA